mgnify:CR=1 FL=1
MRFDLQPGAHGGFAHHGQGLRQGVALGTVAQAVDAGRVGKLLKIVGTSLCLDQSMRSQGLHTGQAQFGVFLFGVVEKGGIGPVDAQIVDIEAAGAGNFEGDATGLAAWLDLRRGEGGGKALPVFGGDKFDGLDLVVGPAVIVEHFESDLAPTLPAQPDVNAIGLCFEHFVPVLTGAGVAVLTQRYRFPVVKLQAQETA